MKPEDIMQYVRQAREALDAVAQLTARLFDERRRAPQSITNSTELIAHADRRYAEVRGESRGWGQASWCNGYIQGWLERRAPQPDALVEAGGALAQRLRALQGLHLEGVGNRTLDFSTELQGWSTALETKEGMTRLLKDFEREKSAEAEARRRYGERKDREAGSVTPPAL